MPDYNNALAKAILDRYDTEFPAGSLLQLYSGSAPGADNAPTGTKLAEITLPASPWNAATNGTPSSKTKNGTWSTTGLAGAGGGTNAGYYRLINAAGTKLEEGTVSITGGAGEAQLDNINIAQNQPVVVNSFTKTL